MSERISVHLLTANRPAELAVCLSSLLRQSFRAWDLFILDGSLQPVRNAKIVEDCINRARSEGHGFQYYYDPIRRGIGQARNQLLEKDKWNELVCRIDDDSWVEPDYLQKLYDLIQRKDTAAAGGIVPVFGQPEFTREPNMETFNKLAFSENGVAVGDDGGFSYEPNAIIKSDHLRSSFLFKKTPLLEVGGFALESGFTGWREETIACMKLRWAGYKLWTDTSAKCWHLMSPSGGGRVQDADQRRAQVEDFFQHWSARLYKEKGWPV